MQTATFYKAPGRLHHYLLRVLTALQFMPRITLVCDPDENGRTVLITYHVFCAYWINNGKTRVIKGLPGRVRSTDGNQFYDNKRDWRRTACDNIEYDLETRKGIIEFHHMNYGPTS